MELIVKKIEQDEVKTIETSFSESFLESINSPYYNQKVFKYLTYKNYFQIEDEEALKMIDIQHYYDWQYVSTSYTWDYIFLAIANEKIGIDIETIRDRTPEMIDFFSEEYDLIWWKTRENFFLLWTAEECIIKTSNACFFEEGKNVKIKSLEKKAQKLWGLSFSYESIMTLNERDYKVYTWKIENLIYSISILVKD